MTHPSKRKTGGRASRLLAFFAAVVDMRKRGLMFAMVCGGLLFGAISGARYATAISAEIELINVESLP